MSIQSIIPSYVTTDLVLAATLRIYDIVLDNMTMVDKKRAVFYFNNVPDDLLMKFDTQQLSVEPIAFHNAVVALSNAIKRLKE